MSRSNFALRFKTLVGVPPLDYLARWRMQSAIRTVRSTDRTIASIAGEFGYASEAAFSNAFKRITGHPPTHYRP
ncbi:helix-turn-helix domain-containing protein [Saccharopolyspora sp. 5N708]|uniref:helix-turn-helix domain-containing protein n=1 Tax=Saccharopolyspora sp. 5N708 TaxID=3457424 RepID=UPI003FCFBF68